MKIKIHILPEWLKNWYLNLLSPFINLFVSLEVNPNFFTTIGLIISIIAAYFFATGSLRLAGILVLLGGTFDIIDGMVARATNRVTKFGALYDSTLDRYAEVIMFFGLAYYFVRHNWILYGINLALIISVAVSVALGGSVMTSYVRARAEGLGFQCKVGIMQRQERVVFIGFGAVIHQYTLIFAILLIAIFANVTAIQRLYHIWTTENNRKKEKLSEV